MYCNNVTYGAEILGSSSTIELPSLNLSVPLLLSPHGQRLCVTHGVTLCISWHKGSLLLEIRVAYPVVYTGVKRHLNHAYEPVSDIDEPSLTTKSQLRTLSSAIIELIETTLTKVSE